MRPDDPYATGTWFEPIGDYVEENYLKFAYTKGTLQEAAFLREALALEPGHLVLDVACGLGRHAVELARDPGARVLGVDLSKGLLRAGRARAKDAGAAVGYVRADARAIPAAGKFDAAYSVCEGAFGLLGDMRPFVDGEGTTEDWDYTEFVRGSDAEHVRLLRSVHDALKPGGLFLLSALHSLCLRNDPHFDPVTSVVTDLNEVRDPRGRKAGFMVPVRCFTAREVTALLDAAGFKVVSIMGGTSGDYGTVPLLVDDAEVLVLAQRPAQT